MPGAGTRLGTGERLGSKNKALDAVPTGDRALAKAYLPVDSRKDLRADGAENGPGMMLSVLRIAVISLILVALVTGGVNLALARSGRSLTLSGRTRISTPQFSSSAGHSPPRTTRGGELNSRSGLADMDGGRVSHGVEQDAADVLSPQSQRGQQGNPRAASARVDDDVADIVGGYVFL